MCSGWNTESDNNTQFQLNSLMCDLYLRNCFLLKSEVFRTLQHPVCIYANIAWVFHEAMQKFCIIWHCEKLVCSCVLTRDLNYWRTKDMTYRVFFFLSVNNICYLSVCLWLFALLPLFCCKQTWRTSRPREEVQSGFVKVKEWSYCVALHPILEVR